MTTPRPTLRLLLIHSLAIIAGAVGTVAQELPELKPIERRIPPKGIELDKDDERRLTEYLGKLEKEHAALGENPLEADVAALLKAVRLALVNGEFYSEKDVEKAVRVLALAEQTLKDAKQGTAPQPNEKGLLVRGFRSKIDASAQPYGLYIPDGLDQSEPVRLYVWLHGRGDKNTDLHYINQRLNSVGQFKPDNAIVLHPFGRHCMGFKSAGEIDVLEALAHVKEHYNIDPNRLALMGFSMGGAGAWHIGGHYTDHFAVVHAGAGFAETPQYIGLKKDDYRPEYEQTLWGVYDMPNYARNFLNLPVIAYSGENDKQKQAADVMQAAIKEQGKNIPHIIGPGMGHKYHPDSQREVEAFIDAALDEGRDPWPEEVHLQTRTLRYNKMHWVQALGLEEHWKDSRIDARLDGSKVVVSTENVSKLDLISPPTEFFTEIEIDGQSIKLRGARRTLLLKKNDEGSWDILAGWNKRTLRESGMMPDYSRLTKKPGLQGPIYDAYLDTFVVIAPERESENPLFQRWVEFELEHLKKRWRELYRAELPVVRADEFAFEDYDGENLVLYGDTSTNRWIKWFDAANDVLEWNEFNLSIGGYEFSERSTCRR